MTRNLAILVVSAVLFIGGLVAAQVWPIEELLVATSTGPSMPLVHGPGQWQITGQAEVEGSVSLEEAADDTLRAWQAAGWTANAGLDLRDGHEVATLAAWRGNCSAVTEMALDDVGRLFVAATVTCTQ